MTDTPHNGRRAIVPQDMQYYVDDWQMSPAVQVGELLFLTGMTGAGPDGNVATDAAGQIRRAFERVAHVFAEAGASPGDIVEMTSYHVGLHSHLDVFREIRAEYITQPFPAWTAIKVEGFATPGTVVELRIVASAKGPIV